MCPDHEAANHAGWDADYIRSSCQVCPCTTPVKSLGVLVGHAGGEANESLRRTLDKLSQAREGIASLDEPAAELVLMRKCLDVAKVAYNLRCHGDR